jgi:hypothetical protein
VDAFLNARDEIGNLYRKKEKQIEIAQEKKQGIGA